MAKVQISIDDDLLVRVDEQKELTKTLNDLQGAMLKVTERCITDWRNIK